MSGRVGPITQAGGACAASEQHPCPWRPRAYGWRQFKLYVLAVVATFGLTLNSCSGAEPPDTRGTATGEQNITKLADEAFVYADIVLPPSAEILGGAVDSGIDVIYWVTISVAPDEFDQLISASSFGGEFFKDGEPFQPTLGGPELAVSPKVLLAHDNYNTAKRRVGRNILVDQRDEDIWYVHFQLF